MTICKYFQTESHDDSSADRDCCCSCSLSYTKDCHRHIRVLPGSAYTESFWNLKQVMEYRDPKIFVQMILYGELRYRPLWMRLTTRMSNLLLCLSTAVNIIIYSYKAPPVSITIFSSPSSFIGPSVPGGVGQRKLPVCVCNLPRYICSHTVTE